MSRTRAAEQAELATKAKKPAKLKPTKNLKQPKPRKQPGTSAAAGPVPEQPPKPPPPPGQRLYDMPYGSPAPRLVNPELGLDSLIARAGHNAGYEIDLTLLDAPDHRLMRSGVLLAHRVLDGRGEWYLGAPDWVPLLPEELIESMSQADLSEQMTDLIRPFRRRAPLSPVAALRCERREFALRSRQGPPLALLRDDKVTVRRGGLTIARYREVMLTPVGAGLQPQQREWLDTCLIGAGATVLTRFPPLVRRLGAPATGPTDFPEPTPLDAGASFASFVSTLIALRLRQLLTGDLRLRGGDPSAALELTRTAALLRGELDGLGGVLDSSWTDDLIDELDWLAAVPVTVGGSPDELTAQVSGRLRGERYLSLLDRLVVAARGVRLGDVATESAGAVLGRVATDQLAALARAGSRLAVDGPARAWDRAGHELERMAVVDQVIAHLDPDAVAERHRRLARCRLLLAQVNAFDADADGHLDRVDRLTPEEAFTFGREFERSRVSAQTARAAFLVAWAKTRKKLGV